VIEQQQWKLSLLREFVARHGWANPKPDTIVVGDVSFHQAMFAALNSLLLATIPDVLSATAAQIGLRTFSIPVPIEPITIAQAWHPRFTADPIHRLIRESLVRACSGLPAIRSQA
jgi:DNA-binding transcriptional LysR family regulator